MKRFFGPALALLLALLLIVPVQALAFEGDWDGSRAASDRKPTEVTCPPASSEPPTSSEPTPSAEPSPSPDPSEDSGPMETADSDSGDYNSSKKPSSGKKKDTATPSKGSGTPDLEVTQSTGVIDIEKQSPFEETEVATSLETEPTAPSADPGKGGGGLVVLLIIMILLFVAVIVLMLILLKKLKETRTEAAPKGSTPATEKTAVDVVIPAAPSVITEVMPPKPTITTEVPKAPETVLQGTAPLAASPAAPAAAATVAAAAVPVYSLVGQTGLYEGQRHPIQKQLRFGRGRINDIAYPVDASGISSTHCALLPRENGVILVDLGSTYGTFLLDGTRLKPNHNYLLKRGDGFYLCNKKQVFRIE